jgi:hypothetical protein
MKRIGDITLVENSTASNQPKIFRAQTVDITHAPDTVVQTVDGQLAKGSHPSTILWVGGTAKDLENITNVKIIGINGVVLVDGELNTHHGRPHEVAEGVKFFVLNPD